MSLARPVNGRFWRILSPRWAHDPLSGEGAARHGGRWNRPGDAALYLSGEIETAFAEYQQELGTRPGTFLAYEVEEAQLIDLRDPEALGEARLTAGDLIAPWKEIAWVRQQTPASWRAAAALSTLADGLLFPSVQREGGTNLVLWRWNGAGGPKVRFHDPKEEFGR